MLGCPEGRHLEKRLLLFGNALSGHGVQLVGVHGTIAGDSGVTRLLERKAHSGPKRDLFCGVTHVEDGGSG